MPAPIKTLTATVVGGALLYGGIYGYNQLTSKNQGEQGKLLQEIREKESVEQNRIDLPQVKLPKVEPQKQPAKPKQEKQESRTPSNPPPPQENHLSSWNSRMNANASTFPPDQPNRRFNNPPNRLPPPPQKYPNPTPPPPSSNGTPPAQQTPQTPPQRSDLPFGSGGGSTSTNSPSPAPQPRRQEDKPVVPPQKETNPSPQKETNPPQKNENKPVEEPKTNNGGENNPPPEEEKPNANNNKPVDNTVTQPKTQNNNPPPEEKPNTNTNENKDNNENKDANKDKNENKGNENNLTNPEEKEEDNKNKNNVDNKDNDKNNNEEKKDLPPSVDNLNPQGPTTNNNEEPLSSTNTIPSNSTPTDLNKDPDIVSKDPNAVEKNPSDIKEDPNTVKKDEPPSNGENTDPKINSDLNEGNSLNGPSGGFWSDGKYYPPKEDDEPPSNFDNNIEGGTPTETKEDPNSNIASKSGDDINGPSTFPPSDEKENSLDKNDECNNECNDNSNCENGNSNLSKLSNDSECEDDFINNKKKKENSPSDSDSNDFTKNKSKKGRITGKKKNKSDGSFNEDENYKKEDKPDTIKKGNATDVEDNAPNKHENRFKNLLDKKGENDEVPVKNDSDTKENADLDKKDDKKPENKDKEPKITLISGSESNNEGSDNANSSNDEDKLKEKDTSKKEENKIEGSDSDKKKEEPLKKNPAPKGLIENFEKGNDASKDKKSSHTDAENDRDINKKSKDKNKKKSRSNSKNTLSDNDDKEKLKKNLSSKFSKKFKEDNEDDIAKENNEDDLKNKNKNNDLKKPTETPKNDTGSDKSGNDDLVEVSDKNSNKEEKDLKPTTPIPEKKEETNKNPDNINNPVNNKEKNQNNKKISKSHKNSSEEEDSGSGSEFSKKSKNKKNQKNQSKDLKDENDKDKNNRNDELKNSSDEKHSSDEDNSDKGNKKKNSKILPKNNLNTEENNADDEEGNNNKEEDAKDENLNNQSTLNPKSSKNEKINHLSNKDSSSEEDDSAYEKKEKKSSKKLKDNTKKNDADNEDKDNLVKKDDKKTENKKENPITPPPVPLKNETEIKTDKIDDDEDDKDDKLKDKNIKKGKKKDKMYKDKEIEDADDFYKTNLPKNNKKKNSIFQDGGNISDISFNDDLLTVKDDEDDNHLIHANDVNELLRSINNVNKRKKKKNINLSRFSKRKMSSLLDSSSSDLDKIGEDDDDEEEDFQEMEEFIGTLKDNPDDLTEEEYIKKIEEICEKKKKKSVRHLENGAKEYAKWKNHYVQKMIEWYESPYKLEQKNKLVGLYANGKWQKQETGGFVVWTCNGKLCWTENLNKKIATNNIAWKEFLTKISAITLESISWVDKKDYQLADLEIVENVAHIVSNHTIKKASFDIYATTNNNKREKKWTCSKDNTMNEAQRYTIRYALDNTKIKNLQEHLTNPENLKKFTQTLYKLYTQMFSSSERKRNILDFFSINRTNGLEAKRLLYCRDLHLEIIFKSQQLQQFWGKETFYKLPDENKKPLYEKFIHKENETLITELLKEEKSISPHSKEALKQCFIFMNLLDNNNLHFKPVFYFFLCWPHITFPSKCDPETLKNHFEGCYNAISSPQSSLQFLGGTNRKEELVRMVKPDIVVHPSILGKFFYDLQKRKEDTDGYLKEPGTKIQNMYIKWLKEIIQGLTMEDFEKEYTINQRTRAIVLSNKNLPTEKLATLANFYIKGFDSDFTTNLFPKFCFSVRAKNGKQIKTEQEWKEVQKKRLLYFFQNYQKYKEKKDDAIEDIPDTMDGNPFIDMSIYLPNKILLKHWIQYKHIEKYNSKYPNKAITNIIISPNLTKPLQDPITMYSDWSASNQLQPNVAWYKDKKSYGTLGMNYYAAWDLLYKNAARMINQNLSKDPNVLKNRNRNNISLFYDSDNDISIMSNSRMISNLNEINLSQMPERLSTAPNDKTLMHFPTNTNLSRNKTLKPNNLTSTLYNTNVSLIKTTTLNNLNFRKSIGGSSLQKKKNVATPAKPPAKPIPLKSFQENLLKDTINPNFAPTKSTAKKKIDILNNKVDDKKIDEKKNLSKTIKPKETIKNKK